MMGSGAIGRFLVIPGILSLALVRLLTLFDKGLPRGLSGPGHLPGNITFQQKNFSIVLPIATSLLISFILLKTPFPVMAGETIRVAVFLNRSSISFAGSGVLTLHSETGEEIGRRRGPVQVVPGSPGLVLNGRELGRTELIIRSSVPPLIVNGREFEGSFSVKQVNGHLLGVNQIDVEDYLKGVVPVEISPEWHPEALKTQAVAARTYALYQRSMNRNRDYDLVSTTDDQVYQGLSKSHPSSDMAISETRDLVVTFHGHPILSMYHSTSAGQTESAEVILGMNIPYLTGVICPFDRFSPWYQWTREISLGRIEQAFRQSGYMVGFISNVTPFDWTSSGRVARIRVLHSKGQIILGGNELRKVLGYRELPSTRFSIEEFGERVRFKGQGAGHAVGMCQWGAKEMAELGYPFKKILLHFYTGTEVVPYSGLQKNEGS